ncbi:MAG: hypothetical protein WC333_06615 [Dehalococcoidia bacterium]|jgi:hypothetical protein
MSVQLDRAVEREEKQLEESLNSGEISMREYNQSLREMYRSAREEEDIERRQGYYGDPYNPYIR